METLFLVLSAILIVVLISETLSYRKFIQAVDKFNTTNVAFLDGFEAARKDIIQFHLRVNDVENSYSVLHEKFIEVLRELAELRIYVNILMAAASIDKELLSKAVTFTNIDQSE